MVIIIPDEKKRDLERILEISRPRIQDNNDMDLIDEICRQINYQHWEDEAKLKLELTREMAEPLAEVLAVYVGVVKRHADMKMEQLGGKPCRSTADELANALLCFNREMNQARDVFEQLKGFGIVLQYDPFVKG